MDDYLLNEETIGWITRSMEDFFVMKYQLTKDKEEKKTIEKAIGKERIERGLTR